MSGVLVSKTVILLCVGAGLGVILIVGLLSGLIARPKNCIEAIDSFTLQPANTRTLPTLSTASTKSPLTTTQNLADLRLPTIIQPSNYNLNLRVFFRPYETQDYFNGTVIIDFKLTNASKRIVLHCDSRLEVLNTVQITALSNNQVTNVRRDQQTYAANQLYVIALDSELPVGSYKLKMDYNGNYGPESNIIGFYRTQYTEDGVQKWADCFYITFCFGIVLIVLFCIKGDW